jgi:hypothetical protein
VPEAPCLQAILILALEPERLSEPAGHHREDRREAEALSQRRSSCLQFQFLSVEAFSFLPKCQRNRCNLSRQRETSHGGLHAFGQQSQVELAERSGTHARHSSRSLEQTFQIMVVVFIQAANGDQLLRALQLPFAVAVLPAGVNFQGQSAVGPQLPLGAIRANSRSIRTPVSPW